MATPFTAETKNLHEQAIECIIKATEAADRNEQDILKGLIQQAKMLAMMTARKLKAMGMHRQADDYISALNEHISRVWHIANIRNSDKAHDRMAKAKEASLKLRKDMHKCIGDCGCNCGKEDKKDDVCKCELGKSLSKGFDNPFVPSSPARKEYSETGKVKPTWEVGTVKADPKLAYKMLHELKSDQQDQVQQKYPQGSHSRYAYPVHRETGELAHGQRIPLPPGMAVRAQSAAFKELKPEHRTGAFVQINAPGHAAHGRKGIVMAPNPNLPGKVGVQVGATKAHALYVDPHQVKVSKASSRVEKAMQTLFNIQKVFMKSEKNASTESSID